MAAAEAGGATIRTFRAGDVGMIWSRQAILYAETQGWGRELEVNVGEATTDFLRRFKPGRDQCWVAELDGAMAGAVFITDEGGGVARLRLLHVEPAAQGRGVGSLLVRTCVEFARGAGYHAVTLWTHTMLAPARRIYAAAGFKLVHTETHTVFGTPVQGETWRLDLQRE